MERLGLGLSLEDDNQTEPQIPQNPHEARKQSIQKCIQSLVHACQCRDMTCKLQSCIKMKRVIRHTRDCRLRNNGNCSICKQFVALCLFHARSCNENQCSVPLCSNIKQKLKKQRIEHQIHQDRLIMRRMVEMRAHSGAPTPSAHVAPSPAPSTPRRIQQKSPSASPHPSAATSSPKPRPQQQSPGDSGGGAGGGKAMSNVTGSFGKPSMGDPTSSPAPPQKPTLPVSMPNVNSPSPAAIQIQHQQQQQQLQQQQLQQQQQPIPNQTAQLDIFGLPATPRQYNQMQEMQQQQPQLHQQQRQPFMGGGGAATAYQGHYTNPRMVHQMPQQYHQQQQQMYLHQQQQRQQQFVGGGGFQGQYGNARILHQPPQQYLTQQQMYAQAPQGPVSNHHMMHHSYHSSIHPQMMGHHGTGPPPYPGGRNPMMGQGQRMMPTGKPISQQQLHFIQQQQQQHAQMQGGDLMTKQDQLLKLAETL